MTKPYDELDVAFGLDELKKAVKNPLENALMNDINWDTKPTADVKKHVSAVMRSAFINEILGDSTHQLEKYLPKEDKLEKRAKGNVTVTFADGLKLVNPKYLMATDEYLLDGRLYKGEVVRTEMEEEA
jgi:hypothetical protein